LNEIQITLNSQVVKFPVDRAFTNDETIELKPGEKPPGIDVKSEEKIKSLFSLFYFITPLILISFVFY
jgi:hypothetical protein